MFEQPPQHILHTIIQDGTTLLQAGLIEEVLKLTLTISQANDVKKVYKGEIRNRQEYGKLKDNFSTMEEILEAFKDRRNVKLNLDDFSVALISQLGKTIIEFAKITLKQSEEATSELSSLENIINRCNQKDQLSHDEIKESFEMLAKEIIEVRQMLKRERFQGSKEEMMVLVSQQSRSNKQKYQSLQQRYSQVISQLRKEIDEINTKNGDETLKLKGLEKTVQENSTNIESSFKAKNDLLNQEMRNLNELLKGNIIEMQKTKENSKQIFQKIKNVQQKMTYLDFYVNLQKQKNQRWSKKFTFDGKTLTKVINHSGSYQQFVFFKKLKFPLSKFIIKSVKSPHRHLFVGVIDYSQFQKDNYVLNQNNNVRFWARTDKKEGDALIYGFEAGETMEVIFNGNNKTVRWMVNEKERSSYCHNMLGEKERELFPFVLMYDKDDITEFQME